MRFLAGLTVTLLLIATTYPHFPDIILFKNGKSLSLLDDTGAAKTITVLGSALLIGSILILPSLVFLVYSFEKNNKMKHR